MRGRIAVDRELCKGCRYCILSCPKGVISIEEKFNLGGFFPAYPERPERCTGCGHCACMCPELAIGVWREHPARSSSPR